MSDVTEKVDKYVIDPILNVYTVHLHPLLNV